MKRKDNPPSPNPETNIYDSQKAKKAEQCQTMSCQLSNTKASKYCQTQHTKKDFF
jgi:hypothetical protein